MKKTTVATTTIIATMLGIAGAAKADGSAYGFTPIEAFPPEVRQQISVKVEEMTKDLDIDWETMAVGVADNGKIAIVPRSNMTTAVAGTFSCATAHAASVGIEEK